MKISRLTLTNFRCYDERTIEFDQARTLILGPLAVGKSSVFDAVRYLLTGTCRGLDKGGKGADRLVRLQAPKSAGMMVSALIEHGGKTAEVARGFDGRAGTFTVEGFAGAQRDHERGLTDWLGVPLGLLGAILDGEEFFALGHADAKDLLMGLLGVTVTLPDGKTVGLTALDGLYQAAFDRRKTAKAALKMLPALAAPADAVGDLEGVRAKVAELRAEREGLVAKRAGDLALIDPQVNRRSLEAEIAECQRKMTADPHESIVAAEAEAQASVTALAAEVERLEGEGMGLADGSNGPSQLEALKARGSALMQFSPAGGCVLGGGVKCPVKAEAFKVAGQACYDDADKHAEEHRVEQARRTALAKARGALEQRKVELGRSQRRLESSALVVTRVQVLAREIESLGVEVPVEAVHPLDAAIKELDVRLQRGQDVIEKKIRLKSEHDVFQRNSQERKSLAERVEATEKDCEVYGPGGLRVAALAGGLDRFHSAVNVVLEPFGYQVKILVEPWDLQVNGLSWVMLSTSEKLRVSVALQVAMAVTSGLGFTMIDQVELLLKTERSILSKVTASVPMEQIWFSRSLEREAEAPSPQGVQVIRL